ncbi:unnamed protein product [Camellia sinensis]
MNGFIVEDCFVPLKASDFEDMLRPCLDQAGLKASSKVHLVCQHSGGEKFDAFICYHFRQTGMCT